MPVEDLDVVEEQFVGLAAYMSPAELRSAARQVCDLLDSDGPEPEEHKAAARESLTLTTADRGVKFKGYLANENAELLRAVIHAGARPHKTLDGQHDPRPRDKRQADALTTALTIAASVLPSERSLSEQYGVNRRTIQRAIAQLRFEGLVQSIHGKGVFVRRSGDWPSRTHSRTVTVDGNGNYVDSESADGEWKDIEEPNKYHTNAEGPLALAFNVPPGTSLFASDRLLENSSGTRIFVRTYLPVS